MGAVEAASLARVLSQATSIAVLTGAGVSAESGVPTFRGAGGLWRGQNALRLATPGAFARDPETVWEFYDWRRTQLKACRPNAAHRALVTLEQRTPRFTLITQNVDGLHAAAGSKRVLELHGNIWTVRCTAGCGDVEDLRAPRPRPLPPRCRCGAIQRPGVVWFGESLPDDAFFAAERAARDAELFLVIGTSALVEPAASLPHFAWSSGARVVEINPDETPLSALAHDVLREPAAVALPRLIAPVTTDV